MSIILKEISKTFTHNPVLNDLDLTIKKGEFHTLLGPSGEGKSVLLNIIAGLSRQDAGQVIFSGKDMSRTPAEFRPIGYVFQDFALFPNMSVAANISFSLNAQGMGKSGVDKKVQYYLKLLGLTKLKDRLPNELSGGEKQRTAIARALVLDPEIMLFDEPLSHLDNNLHQQLIMELRAIHKKTGVTCLYVTHNREEAMNLADRVSILHNGHIIQTDTPEEVYYRPKTKFVAKFVGAANVVNCRVLEHSKTRTKVIIDEESINNQVTLDLKYFPIFSKRQELAICLHAEKLKISNSSYGKNCFPVNIINAHLMDSLVNLSIDFYGLEILVKMARSQFDMNSESYFLNIDDDCFYPICGRCQRQSSMDICCEHYVPEFKTQFAKGV